jgi:outer membrane protein with beta-barrel domain
MEVTQMKVTKVLTFGAILLLGMAAWAQEFPRAELGVDYSYARYSPSASYSKGHSLNGGGGSATVNINDYLGIRMDLQGYGSNLTSFNIPANPTFPSGLSGSVQGNLFTYLFGPQIKVRAHHFQPFGDLLFGGAHTNVYGNAFKQLCQPIAGGCALSKAPAADAFAMEFGGGVDIPINKWISFRPAEIDYLMTRFTNPISGTSNQNNFRYSVGLTFNLGHTSY